MGVAGEQAVALAEIVVDAGHRLIEVLRVLTGAGIVVEAVGGAGRVGSREGERFVRSSHCWWSEPQRWSRGW